MIRVANVLYFTSLAVWIGGLVTLVAVVAPVLFAHARSTADAGRIFAPTLRVFGHVELVCAVVLVVSGLTLHFKRGGGSSAEIAKLVLIGLMVLTLVLSIFAAGIPIERERASIPNFEALDRDDPARARFNSLHKWSERLVGANILLGVALLVLSAATIRK